MADRYDLAVLGGGSGGYVAAIRGAQLGMNVVVIERDKVGGTCLHRGCIPTKALLQSAALLDQLKSADKFGVNVNDVQVDYSVAGLRRDKVVTQLFRGVEFLLAKNKVTTINGEGMLRGGGTVAVGSSKPQGDTFMGSNTARIASVSAIGLPVE